MNIRRAQDPGGQHARGPHRCNCRSDVRAASCSGAHDVPGVEYVKAGKWKTWDLQLLLGADLRGRTLGVIGFGRIGRALACRAQGFGLRVIYCDPAIADTGEGEPVSLEVLLRESDFVSLHVPLTGETRHIMNEETLSMMKPTAVLVNTSRGPVLDHDALYRALRDHRLFAAGLEIMPPDLQFINGPCQMILLLPESFNPSDTLLNIRFV